jgi:hypothetical protein
LRLITVFFFVANKNQKGNQKKISVFLFWKMNLNKKLIKNVKWKNIVQVDLNWICKKIRNKTRKSGFFFNIQWKKVETLISILIFSGL